MPLIHATSKPAFRANVRNLMKDVGKSPHVKSKDQALAIAYKIKRGGKADGGKVNEPRPEPTEQERRDGIAMLKDEMNTPYASLLQRMSTRSAAKVSDAVPRRAAGGASPPWYVRSEARSMLHTGPINSVIGGRTDHHKLSVPGGAYVLPSDHVSYLGQGNTANGQAVLSRMFSGAPYGASMPSMAKGKRKFADGGAPPAEVPIMAAGGEFIISPDDVARVGGGDMDHGHKILDQWVIDTRKKHVKTLRKLPGPARD